MCTCAMRSASLLFLLLPKIIHWWDVKARGTTESDTRIIKVFIPHTKSFKIFRRTDFHKYEGDPLPGVEALLDGIA